jgi:hypothetical protein
VTRSIEIVSRVRSDWNENSFLIRAQEPTHRIDLFIGWRSGREEMRVKNLRAEVARGAMHPISAMMFRRLREG